MLADFWNVLLQLRIPQENLGWIDVRWLVGNDGGENKLRIFSRYYSLRFRGVLYLEWFRLGKLEDSLVGRCGELIYNNQLE